MSSTIKFQSYKVEVRKLTIYNDFAFQNVIDGDLCEQYNSIDPNKQRNISEELDRTSNEVAKKLEDIRTRFAF